MKLYRNLFLLFLIYVVAAMFSSDVSMDLAQTNWTSAWTYIWFVIGIPLAFIILCFFAVAMKSIKDSFF